MNKITFLTLNLLVFAGSIVASQEAHEEFERFTRKFAAPANIRRILEEPILHAATS